MIAHPCAIMDASFGSTAMDGGDIKQKDVFQKHRFWKTRKSIYNMDVVN